MEKELDSYREYIAQLVKDNPTSSEDEISWMSIAEFDTHGLVNKTLDQFAGGYDDLVKIIRKFMIKY